MCVCARLLLLAALPALAGRTSWCADGEVVSVTEGGGGGGGAGPAFAPRQRTAAVAAAGRAVTLECRVLRLGDKSVSWVRSSDLQILTHAGAVFTADARVSAAETRAAAGAVTRHSLRVARLRVADAGRYECQVNTEPKMSLFFNLTVLDEPVPSVVVSVAGEREVRAARGGAATLACEARYEPPPRALPLPPLDVRWRRAGAREPLALQSSRGGISLDTERWAARVVSRLTLAELRAEDAGAYECVAGDQPAPAGDQLAASDQPAPAGDQPAASDQPAPAAATLRLVLTDEEEHMEMQRDQSASGRARGAGGAAGEALLLALTTLTAVLAAAR